ncbi:hypothetical protein E2320_013287, partial [Naja naja]
MSSHFRFSFSLPRAHNRRHTDTYAHVLPPDNWLLLCCYPLFWLVLCGAQNSYAVLKNEDDSQGSSKVFRSTVAKELCGRRRRRRRKRRKEPESHRPDLVARVVLLHTNGHSPMESHMLKTPDLTATSSGFKKKGLHETKIKFWVVQEQQPVFPPQMITLFIM